nr:LysR family transcriptional regulator [Nannocystis sp. RBIL2]
MSWIVRFSGRRGPRKIADVESVVALNVFVQVAASGSFAGAARELGISPSAVGKSITRLEERTRVRLFERTSRSLRLTPAGQRFVARCRRILAEIDAAEAELSETASAPRGLLRVSIPVAGGPFHRVLADFQEAYPSIDLEVVSTNRNVDIVREGIDAAIRSGPLADSTLRVRELGKFRFVLVASPDYLARRGTPRHPRDLASHDRLQLRRSTSGRLHEWALAEPEQALPKVGRTSLVADNLELLTYFALRGLGLAYVAEILVSDELASGALVKVLEQHIGERMSSHLVWAAGRHTPPKVRAFVDYVSRRLLKRP